MSAAATYLDAILEDHRGQAAADHRPIEELVRSARAMDPARGFGAALRAATGLGVISEVKRRSPSKGALALDLDPAGARRAVRGGRRHVPVGPHRRALVRRLGRRPASAARAAVGLPVLRKDFTVGPRDVCDARLMGADCVLLIAAALDDTELATLHDLAVEVGIDALVEVHDEAEVDRALAVGATLIGVNQRDLVTFEVDTERAVRVAPCIPGDVVRVAESGIRGPADAARLADAGYHAVLVGESLVTSGDPAEAVAP